ncbi:unnamed protein product [Mesocestoides corti]|uniref:Rho-GAP domain-containing protein n=1 Tax=Mesocestoides corti TaxID=53468 RepID=A0A0R3U9A5_MESCO|nr:unnamed protein product [Mesocestoides corti]
MEGDNASVRAEMLQRAALLAAGEHSEEAWYLVHLFQRTQPEELLRICHFTLATFLELDYEYFDEGWPLRSRLDTTPDATLLINRPSRHRSRIWRPKCGRFRSRSPPQRPVLESDQGACRQCHGIDLTDLSTFDTPKMKLGWIKGRNLLPSKLSVFTLTPSSALPTTIGSPLSRNIDFILCQYIIDFLLGRPVKNNNITLREGFNQPFFNLLDLLSTEGLFRRPGSLSRTKHLYTQLKNYVLSGYLGTVRPCSSATCVSTVNSSRPAQSQRCTDITCLLDSALVYDVAGVLLRCLSSARIATNNSNNSDTGLIPPKATELFVQTTQLQYHLKDRHPPYRLDPSNDWMHLLCHGRQLLAYRIIIQLLLPSPERHLLMKLLSLLHKVASNTLETKMSSEALARCLAVAVFGLPEETEAMGSYIDTLINLIELFEELEILPMTIYHKVRAFLKSRLGTSPQKRSNKIGNECGRCIPVTIDKSALKRSWATCQVLPGTTAVNTPPRSFGYASKENRPFPLSHLCIWSRSPQPENWISGTSPRSPEAGKKEPSEERPPRAHSPFRNWKKRRSTESLKKSRSLCLDPKSALKNADKGLSSRH